MENSHLKTIQLSFKQLNMVHTMIRCAEMRMSKYNEQHISLDRKVKAAKRKAAPAYYNLLDLDPEECKLMRQYNTNYCAILADNDDEGEFQNDQIIEIYQLATNIQMILTPRFF